MLQTAVGLDAATAEKVVAHIVTSVSEQQTYVLALAQKKCGEFRQSGLAAEQLAVKLAELDQAESQHREIYFAQLSQMLDPSARQQLDTWIDMNFRSKMQITDIDYSRMLTQTGVNRDVVLSRMCEPTTRR